MTRVEAYITHIFVSVGFADCAVFSPRAVSHAVMGWTGHDPLHPAALPTVTLLVLVERPPDQGTNQAID